MFTALYGLETVTTRYFNVFGPRQDPSSPYSGVISLFISALCDGRRPTIYGDGEHTRDFTYVANVVDGVLRACHAPNVAGQVINVATSGRVSLNHLFRTMRDLTGCHGGADLRRPARRRRQGLAGGHQQGQGAARLHADRDVRGRASRTPWRGTAPR